MQTPRNRKSRAARSGLAVSVLALMAGLGTYSAFTDFTESNDNAFESGYLSIEGLDGSALFNVLNANDGTHVEKCITIENDGTIEYDGLTVSRSAAEQVADDAATPAVDETSGELAEDVTISVERLDGAAVDTTGADCAAFDASADPSVPVAIGGDLLSGAETEDELETLATPGSTVSYKISADVQMENDDQGEDAKGVQFKWAATQG